jgi:mannobiose 2-epimerase
MRFGWVDTAARGFAIDRSALRARPLGAQIEQVLRLEMARWFPTVVDPDGGFVENLDRAWRPTGDARRSLIYQARVTWSAAAYAGFEANERETFSRYAEHGVEFIERAFRDREFGGLFFDVGLNGRPLRAGEKHAIAIAFAIFAAAKTHAVTGSTRSLAIADDGFAWLEEHCRRPGREGIVEEFRRDGSPMPSGNHRRRNPLGLPYGRTTSNTHLHLLEAYIDLLQAHENRRVQSALAGCGWPRQDLVGAG